MLPIESVTALAPWIDYAGLASWECAVDNDFVLISGSYGLTGADRAYHAVFRISDLTKLATTEANILMDEKWFIIEPSTSVSIGDLYSFGDVAIVVSTDYSSLRVDAWPGGPQESRVWKMASRIEFVSILDGERAVIVLEAAPGAETKPVFLFDFTLEGAYGRETIENLPGSDWIENRPNDLEHFVQGRHCLYRPRMLSGNPPIFNGVR